MFSTPRRTRLRTLACIGAIVFTSACGGGGAAVGPSAAVPAVTPGGTTAPPTPTPSVPSGNLVATAGTSFTPASITVVPGSTVVWQIAGATHNVTFGANKPTGGDVGDTAPGNSASRVFPAAGTFTYQCTRHSGMTGQVIVQSGAGTTAPPTTPSPSKPVVVQALGAQFTPEEVSIAPGAVVTWEFAKAGGIVFKDLAPSGGDIPETAAGARVSRTFPVAGDYDYYSAADRNVKGRVRVK